MRAVSLQLAIAMFMTSKKKKTDGARHMRHLTLKKIRLLVSRGVVATVTAQVD